MQSAIWLTLVIGSLMLSVDPAMAARTKGQACASYLEGQNQEVDLVAIENDLMKHTALFFRHRMRPPTVHELSALLSSVDPHIIQSIATHPDFLKKILRSGFGRHIEFSRKRIKTAYARALRGTDTPSPMRTRAIRPSLRRLVQILVFTKSNEQYQWEALTGRSGQFDFSKKGKARAQEEERMLDTLESELSLMLGLDGQQNSEWIFEMPVLFPGGLREVHELSEKEYTPTFVSFEDLELFGPQAAEEIKERLVKARGFVVSAVRPGYEVHWELIESMKAYAKDRGFEVVLLPLDGLTQYLDEDLVNDPEIHVLNQTIENDSLSLRLLPGNDRDQPFAALKKQNLFKIGQQVIVPSHVMAHEVLPTGENHIDQTQFYSTGVVNTSRRIAARGRFQKATADRLAHQFTVGFHVVEKVDAGGDSELGGVTNHWHVRPVPWRPSSRDHHSGIVDFNVGYFHVPTRSGRLKLVREESAPTDIYLPDLHEVVANPQFLDSVLHLLREDAEREIPRLRKIIVPDPIDSRALNHWVEKVQQRRALLQKMFVSGELDFQLEMNKAIATINAILMVHPQVQVVYQFSNHSNEWIEKNLLENPTWLQSIVNGPLIDEIRHAHSAYGYEPLEYLLIHRASVIGSSIQRVADEYRGKINFVDDPSRVRVARLNEPIKLGPADREWVVEGQNHGHKGSNGAKGSDKTHSTSAFRQITGDSHRAAYRYVGHSMWMSVGASSFRQPYTIGGYSSWSVAMALIHENGIAQLVHWDPNTQRFVQDSQAPVLEEQFFGEDPLRVIASTNDDEQRSQLDEDRFLEWLRRQQDFYFRALDR